MPAGVCEYRLDIVFEDVSPLEEIELDYPEIGKGATYTVGHPEPITLPLFRPEIRNSVNVMILSPQLINILRWLRVEIDSGRMSVKDAAALLLKPEKELADALPAKLKAKLAVTGLLGKSKTKLPELFAVAKGISDGKPTTVGVTISAAPAGGMGGATGVPMSVALAMFARGRMERRGVLTPESVIDPDAFFDELAPLCTPIRSDAKELLAITSSS